MESKIVEPLKFGDKDKVKSNRLEEEINRAASGIFGTSVQSPHTDNIPTNHSMMFQTSKDSTRHGGNLMYSSKIKFRESPKEMEK